MYVDIVNEQPPPPNSASGPPAGRPVSQWLPAGAAVAVLATVIVAGVALGNGGDDGASESDGVAATGELAQLTVPDSVPEVIATVETTAPVTKSVLDCTLSKGVAGADVQESSND